jgi:hypothetical protein
MRATQVTSALFVEEGTPGELGFIVQNPAGWPAFAGHDMEFGCINLKALGSSAAPDPKNPSNFSTSP